MSVLVDPVLWLALALVAAVDFLCRRWPTRPFRQWLALITLAGGILTIWHAGAATAQFLFGMALIGVSISLFSRTPAGK